MRRRSIIILAVIIVLVSAIGYAAYGRIRDYRDEHRLFVGCHSDQLSVIAGTYTSAIADHDDRVPARAAVVDSLDSPSRDWLLTCVGSSQPFVWNDQSDKLDPKGRQIPLVWCPDGSHGRHVGVVMLDNGKVASVMRTRAELAESLRQSGR